MRSSPIGISSRHLSAISRVASSAAATAFSLENAPSRTPCPNAVMHLVACLEKELVVLEPHPVRVRDVLARLEAEQHVLRLGVRLVDVVDVVRRDDGHAVLGRPAHQDRVAGALLGDRVVLDLDVVVLAEDREVVLEDEARLGLALFQDRLEHLALEAARRRDEAGAVRAEHLAVDARLVVVAVRVGAAGELDEVAVALDVLGEQDLVVARPVCLVRHAAGRDVELAADDRLDARLLRRRVELGDAVQIPVVRYGNGCVLKLCRALHEALDAGRAVEQRVLGVAVEVAEVRHRARRVRGAARCRATGPGARRVENLAASARRFQRTTTRRRAAASRPDVARTT